MTRERLKRQVERLWTVMVYMVGDFNNLDNQVRDSVRFTVAPEGFAPLDGWPYDKILSELARKPWLEPEQLARVIVKKYLVSYADYEDVCVTQSICDLDRCTSLVNGGPQIGCNELSLSFSSLLC